MKFRLAANTTLLLCLVLFTFACRQLTAETLRIRMIRGCNEIETDSSIPGEMRDITATLQKTLAFKGYVLDGDTTMPLPADESQCKLRVYEITCHGTAEKLSIKIVRRGKTILDTVATIQPGRPVILGGFPARHNQGVRMFVLTVSP